MLKGKMIRIKARSNAYALTKSADQSIYLSAPTNDKQIQISTSCPTLYVDADTLIDAIQEILAKEPYTPKHAKTKEEQEDDKLEH